jgi:chromosome segregation protein
MYLSKLEIFGFKSFAHKVQVTFDSGMTAIVGPNGCGKTNIVDGIRWVLGEQRSSTLRSDKMEDVIFNGTDKRKPLGMAEVLLTIQNTKGILPTEYSEVTIGRRLYRSGESEYLLNGAVCRLRDIIDLFMDTGMGANAYSVIELKMVETILSDKADERRKLFEEAAGVTRYKHRRKEAYRRLEHVQQDLMRVNDIIKEVQKTVNSLERQAKKAEEYNELSARLRALEVNLLEHEYASTHHKHAVLGEKLKVALDDKNRLDEELKRRETLLEVLRDEMSSVEASLNATLREYNNVRDELHAVDETRIIAVERTKTLRDNSKRYEQEKIAAYNQINRLEEGKEKHRHQIEKLTTEVTAVEEELQKKEEDLRLFEAKLHDRKLELRKEQDSVVGIVRNIGERRQEQERTKARIDNLKGRIERADEQNAYYRDEIDDIDGKIDTISAEHKQLRQEFIEAEIKLFRTENRRREISQELDSLRAGLFETKSSIDRSETRLQFLQGLIESNDGVSEGAQYLLANRSWSNDTLEVSTLGESVRTESAYRVAVETILGDASGYIVLDTTDDAQRAIDALKKEGKGKASFICLDRISKLRENTAGRETQALPQEALGWALDVIDTPASLQPVITALCSGILLVRNLSDGRNLLERPGIRECVTLEGERVTRTGIIRGGSRRADEGRSIGKKQQIEELSRDLASLDETRDHLENEIKKKNGELQSIDIKAETEAVKALEKHITSIEIRIAQLQFEKKRADEAIERNETESYELRKDIDDLESMLAGFQPALDALEEKRSETEQHIGMMVEEVERLERERNQRAGIVNQISVRRLDKVNAKSTLEREVQFADSKIEELNNLITQRTGEITAADEELKALRLTIRDTEAKITELRDDITAIEKRREEIERQHGEKRNEVQKIVDAIRDERRLRDDSISITHELEMKLNELALKLQAMEERATEELELRLERKEFPEDDTFDINSAREQIHEMKNRLRKLGGVNFAAFEEYENELERLKFLRSQSEDLLEAEKTLIETIDEINTTAQEKFLQTFRQIRENFIKTFKSLFDEGDECDLRIVDPMTEDQVAPRSIDLLEAKIEIIAKPRGKRPTSITLLSGGEKTLTAIALLFAIYLVKPSPFCILDEVDAPLDDSNIDRFTNMLNQFSNNTQFIVVTHNKRTMEAAAALYGVTMEEKGVSKLVSVRFNESTAAAN